MDSALTPPSKWLPVRSTFPPTFAPMKLTSLANMDPINERSMEERSPCASSGPSINDELREIKKSVSLKGVGKTDFWVGLGSDRLGSTVSRGDARHRSFPVGAWVEVAVDGDVQRVCGREWSARFVRGFSAWEPVRLRGVRRRGLCGSRHEGRDVAASGLLPALHAVARSCAASDLSEVRGAQGRYAVGSGGFRVHVVVRGLRAGAGQGDADRQCGQAVGRARHALVADRRALRVARGGGAGFV